MSINLFISIREINKATVFDRLVFRTQLEELFLRLTIATWYKLSGTRCHEGGVVGGEYDGWGFLPGTTAFRV
jgi:hypothetical protein